MDPLPCPGATEPGLTTCPEDLSATAIAVGDASGPASLWRWSAALALVLAAGGGAFLVLQRRTGLLASGVGTALEGNAHLSSQDTASQHPATGAAPWASMAPDVIEWDEALDGTFDDGPEPPPSPPSPH
jgi:hypothetical protein